MVLPTGDWAGGAWGRSVVIIPSWGWGVGGGPGGSSTGAPGMVPSRRALRGIANPGCARAARGFVATPGSRPCYGELGSGTTCGEAGSTLRGQSGPEPQTEGCSIAKRLSSGPSTTPLLSSPSRVMAGGTGPGLFRPKDLGGASGVAWACATKEPVHMSGGGQGTHAAEGPGLGKAGMAPVRDSSVA